MFDWSDESTAPASSWLWWWGPALVYAGIIFALSSIHRLPTLPGGVTDKWAHSTAYFGLALVVLRALVRGRWRKLSIRQAIAALVLSTAYGASDEFHQLFVPGRTADLRDLAADATGAAIALGLAYILVRLPGRPSGAVE